MAAASPLIIRGFPATDWMLPLRQMAVASRRCSAITKPTIPGATAITDYPKDGINDHVITGANTVNADEHGTKACWWYMSLQAPHARGHRAGSAMKTIRVGIAIP